MSMKKYLVALLIAMPFVASAQTFDQDLFYGLRQNENVKELQEFLADKGFYDGSATGNFFSLTLSSVKKFQAAHGITPTSGYFGPKSRTKANELLAASGITKTEIATESGTTTTPITIVPKTADNVVSSLMEQIRILQQQLAALQQSQQTLSSQAATIQTIQQEQKAQTEQIAQQTQTLQQIQQNTTPTLSSSIPTVTLTSDKNSLLRGEFVSLEWNSTNAVRCSASGGKWVGNRTTSGNETVTLSENGEFAFRISCYNSAGDASNQAEVTVIVTNQPTSPTPPPPPPIPPPSSLTLISDKNSITYGKSFTLTWNSVNATSCFGNMKEATQNKSIKDVEKWGWNGTKANSGTAIITPYDAGTFVFSNTCSNSSGSSKGSPLVSITVLPSFPEVIPIKTSHTYCVNGCGNPSAVGVFGLFKIKMLPAGSDIGVFCDNFPQAVEKDRKAYALVYAELPRGREGQCPTAWFFGTEANVRERPTDNDGISTFPFSLWFDSIDPAERMTYPAKFEFKIEGLRVKHINSGIIREVQNSPIFQLELTTK